MCIFVVVVVHYCVALPLQAQQLVEAIKIPKETIEILKNQVFGFDTFFVTAQEPYEVIINRCSRRWQSHDLQVWGQI